MKIIHVNEAFCIGCGLCRVHCLIEHSRSKDPVKAFKRESPRSLPRVRVEGKGETCFPVQCHHCAEPWCVYSCLTGAMQRNPLTGVVTADPDRCIGCGTCIVSCPCGALVKESDNGTIVKCDLCPDRVTPACVANCPNEALVFSMDGEGAGVRRAG
ncbi:MAG: 4Fe-4S dicluster domain-containing protein [Chloroflexota bacterium]